MDSTTTADSERQRARAQRRAAKERNSKRYYTIMGALLAVLTIVALIVTTVAGSQTDFVSEVQNLRPIDGSTVTLRQMLSAYIDDLSWKSYESDSSTYVEAEGVLKESDAYWSSTLECHVTDDWFSADVVSGMLGDYYQDTMEASAFLSVLESAYIEDVPPWQFTDYALGMTYY